jgi:uncharacterized membrane protein (DUF373 family)
VLEKDREELNLITLITKVQGLIISVLIVMLVVIVLLSTAHLGWTIAQEMWKPPRFLIPVHGLIEIFGYFLLVLIGVELVDTLKAYLKEDVVRVRVVIEVALIAMARKVITEEPDIVAPMTLFGIAALIVGLAIAFYFERQASGNGANG